MPSPADHTTPADPRPGRGLHGAARHLDGPAARSAGPSAPPPALRRRGASAPLIGVGLTLVALLSATALVGGPVVTPSSGAAAWLPADGYRQRFVGPSGATVATEWARGPIATMIAAGPVEAWWWLSLTDVDWEGAEGARWGGVSLDADGVARGRFDTLYSIGADGIRTEVEVGFDGTGRIYHPGRLDVPTDLAAGRRWVSEGTVLQLGADGTSMELTYRASVEASAPPDSREAGAGCLLLAQTQQAGDQTTSVRQTWCPASGLIREESDGTTSTAGATGPATDTTVTGFDWHTADALTFSDHAMNDPTTLAPILTPLAAPAALPDGTVVVADSTLGNLLGLLPGSGDPPLPGWRARPGGRITTVAVFGTTTVAATDARRLIAYGPAGQWLWEAPTTDLALAPPVRFGPVVAVATLDGGVTGFDAATGEQRWRHTMPVEIRIPPVASGDRLLVLDQAGQLDCLDDTGTLLWSTEAGRVERFAVSAGTDPVVVLPRATAPIVTGLSLADGSTRWRTREFVDADDLMSLDDAVVLRGGAATTALDPATGAVLWRWNAERSWAGIGGADRLLLLTDDDLVLLDGAGTELRRWAHTLGDVAGNGGFLAAGSSQVVAYGPTGLAIGATR